MQSKVNIKLTLDRSDYQEILDTANEAIHLIFCWQWFH